MNSPALAIEDHGVIGDLATAALVGIDGTIDFFCAPRFDSPSLFTALLDPAAGAFQLAPRTRERSRQMYLPDSNVLFTRFLSRQGIMELIDFMPVVTLGYPQAICRIARALRGPVAIDVEVAPRFDYARGDHRVERKGEALLFAPSDNGPAFELTGSRRFEIAGGDAHSAVTLEPGRTEWFVFAHTAEASRRPLHGLAEIEEALAETTAWWRRWLAGSTYRGRWRDEVDRAALALKLLTSAEHGAMIAAATFGLPEEPGGVRNWDYRYVWPRDACFALRALGAIGFSDENDDFIRWLEPVCAAAMERPRPLQVMYRLDGGTDLEERTLDHLAGYRGSRPVRIGNQAHQQLQLDIYGELFDALARHDARGWPIHHDLWRQVAVIADWVCASWRQPDEGIWETRGGHHEFLQSRVMCWVALDRAIRLAANKSRPAPIDRWTSERDRIYQDIFARYWNRDLRAFTQYPGVRAADASSLLLPLYGFISPTDPRWLSTLRTIEDRLCEGALVYRYRKDAGADDGLEGQDGTFSVCSFWLVECLARAGDVDRARFLFERMLGYANHVGLYSEQLGPSGEQLGNFPQALTLLGLISAAIDLDDRLSAAASPGPGRAPAGETR